MSDQVKTTDALKESSQKINDRLEKAPDALAARNAPNDELEAARELNPNRPTGMNAIAARDGIFKDSLDKPSFQLLVAIKDDGNEEIVDKNSPRPQKDKKDIRTDPHPTRIMPAMTPEAEASIRSKSEAKDKQAAKNEKGTKADTGTLKAIAEDQSLPKESRDLAGFYQEMRTASKARGQSTEVIDKTAGEVLAPELKALKSSSPQEIYGEFMANNPADHPYAANDSLPVIKTRETPMLEGYVSEPELSNTEGWFTAAQKISQLPMDMQLEVIGSGMMAGIEQYQHDERERAWGQLIGTVQGTGEVLQGLAKIADFGAACIIGDHERAGKMGDEFGATLGQTIVGGIRLFQAADQYLFNIGYTGDYAKPFRDVTAAGHKLDEQWSQLPPREQERIKAKLITEMIEGGAIGAGGANAAQRASKFTEVLDAIAVEAKELHAAAKPALKKAVKAVNNAVDELVQPLGNTGMGVRMPIPKDALKDETKMLMSKADDVSDQGRLVNKGVDAAGEALKFADESDIELGIVRQGQDGVWQQAPFPRGDDIHVVLGENLPSGTKTIDRVVYKKGLVESQKSIDLKADTYQKMGALESRLRGCFHDLEIYDGQAKPRSGFVVKGKALRDKVLHFGIEDGAMTPQQKAIFEKLGKEIAEYNETRPPGKAPITFKVTVVK